MIAREKERERGDLPVWVRAIGSTYPVSGNILRALSKDTCHYINYKKTQIKVLQIHSLMSEVILAQFAATC